MVIRAIERSFGDKWKGNRQTEITERKKGENEEKE